MRDVTESTRHELITDDLFIYCAMHGDAMLITYEPEATPVAMLGKALEQAVLRDLDVYSQWFDLDLEREVILCGPRSTHGTAS